MIMIEDVGKVMREIKEKERRKKNKEE